MCGLGQHLVHLVGNRLGDLLRPGGEEQIGDAAGERLLADRRRRAR